MIFEQKYPGAKGFNREAFRRRKNGDQAQGVVLKSTMTIAQNTKLMAKPEMLDFNRVNFKSLAALCPPLAIPRPLRCVCRRNINELPQAPASRNAIFIAFQQEQ